MSQESSVSTRLIPIPQWNEYHAWPPVGGLRHLAFNATSNGFKSAFKRIGRRIMVDEAEFFACVERKNGHGAKQKARTIGADAAK